jgi:hypothetical protein
LKALPFVPNIKISQGRGQNFKGKKKKKKAQKKCRSFSGTFKKQVAADHNALKRCQDFQDGVGKFYFAQLFCIIDKDTV